MVELIEGLDDRVVGLHAVGKLTGRDYEDVIVPEIDARLRRHKKVRLLYHFGAAFEGFDGRAVWEDTKVGLRHLFQFERIAVVSDIDWVQAGVRAAGFLIPCPVRIFDDDHMDEARRWISE